jgi:hypothetical protein
MPVSLQNHVTIYKSDVFVAPPCLLGMDIRRFFRAFGHLVETLYEGGICRDRQTSRYVAGVLDLFSRIPCIAHIHGRDGPARLSSRFGVPHKLARKDYPPR